MYQGWINDINDSSNSRAKVGLVALCVLVLCGCSRSSSAPHLSLRLQWYPQAQFAGYIVADARGLYKQQNLSVELRPAGPDLKPQFTVASGSDDVGVGVSNQVITARSNGVPLTIIAQIFQDSANRYVLKKENTIRSLTELRGKNIGLWLGGDEVEFAAMLKTAHMTLSDVHVVPQGFSVVPFLQHQYLLSQVTTYNELIEIEDHIPSDKLQVLTPSNYECAIVGDMLFTTEGFLRSHPDEIRRFLAASLAGWKFSFEHPDEAVDIILRYNRDLKRDEQRKQLDAIMRLTWMGEAVKNGIGYMDPNAYKTAERVLFDSGQLKTHVDISRVFSPAPWNAVERVNKFVAR